MNRHRFLIFVLLLTAEVLVLSGAASAAPESEPVLQCTGSQLGGGGAAQFGTSFFGESAVNMVYAQANGERSRLTTTFSLARVPPVPHILTLVGRDDDAASLCPIEIRLNDTILFKGPSGFPGDRFIPRTFPISAGAFRAGSNTLTILNTAPAGEVGQPPWFMVASVTIAPKGFDPLEWKRQNVTDFMVRVPQRDESFLERNAGKAPPSGSFAIRGTKGFAWTPEQYLAEIPTLVRFRMNFLMNCYLSLFSKSTGPQGESRMTNEWWLPIPDAKKRAYEKVFETARKNGIDYCFAVHPQLSSPRPLDPKSETDFEAFWQHFAWAQSKGVRWFSVPLDDVHIGGAIRIDGAEHARFVNRLFARLRKNDAGAQLIFCPTWYWGDGTDPAHRPYLEALARDLNPDIYLFWTGPSVVPEQITRQQAETFKGIVQHRVILWENYPVNDGSLALHLGPVVGRDKDLGSVLDGYMSNPHFPQNEINRLPLFTIADYTFDPAHYDPLASAGQAIRHEAQTPAQRAVLKDLMELFPGRVPNTGYNAVIAEYKRIAATPHDNYVAKLYIQHVAEVSQRLNKAFPDKYSATKATLSETLTQIRSLYEAQYGEKLSGKLLAP